LIVANQPTWGLDVGAVAYVHQRLLDASARGACVLLISDDLDEILALADRIAVMHAGRLTAARAAAQWTRAQIGLAMAGAAPGAQRPMRLEPRAARSRVALVAAPFGAIAFTLAATLLLVAWAGAPIRETYALMFAGGFGSRFAWSETLTRATPLILTGLAAAVAFRARLWNIGAEGQLYAGALAAVAVGGLHGGTGFDVPAPVLFPAMPAAAIAAGAILLLVPTFLRTRFGVDEVVTTLLLNFIVLLFVSMMLDGPMKDPSALGWPQSVALRDDLQVDKLFPRTGAQTGLAYAGVLALLLAFVMRYTTLGFEARAVGANARAAAFVGVPVARTIAIVAAISGGLAGLAGAIEVAGRSSH
jgi:simple sugar transport system permease protein